MIVILVKHLFHIPWKLALTVTVISGIILGVAESISVPLLTRTFSFTLKQAISDPLMRILFTLPHLAFLSGVTYLAARRGWRLRFLDRMISIGQRSERNDLSGKVYLFFLFLVQTLMLVLLNFSFHIYSARVFPSLKLSTLVAISSAVIMASALATILVVNYLLKVAEREARLETELSHIKEMQSLSLKMRSQHHDFYNHLTAIYGYLKASHCPEAEHYIETLYENVRQIENLMGISPPELGALLSLKLEEAKTRGIEFRWRVNVKHEVLPVSPEELTQLTGNLLDNALDAAASGHPQRIDLTLSTNKLGLMLHVSNTGDPIPQHIRENIFAPEFTTKDGNKHRGLGLFIIKQLVDRCGGQLELTEPEEYPGVQFAIFIPWKG